MKLPEILAPAGSPESLTAAVRAGADAVYLGGHFLNARRNAENFDDAALAGAVSYCHGRGVRVYLTVNTLLTDAEWRPAVQALEQACALGVDALLVQDLGLARLCRAACPGMLLHASTQLSIHDRAGVEEAAEMGFSRVVLARELSLDEIAAIARDCPCELEVFVHGALCMSVSGQCYLSAMLGGRSGNRGLCAQPCRLPFEPVGTAPRGRGMGLDDVTPHADEPKGPGRCLSLRDLSAPELLPKLGALGVCSLKIEGRMKRPEYVAAATDVCRRAAAGERVPKEKLEALQAVFSRSGFTDGYLTGRRGTRMFGTRRREDVTAAQRVLRELHALYENEFPRVGVTMQAELRPGKPAQLAVRDEDGRCAEAAGETPEPARSAPLTAELLREKLGKTGGTPFFAQKVEARIAPGLSLPVRELNRMRRQALERLLAERSRPRPVPFGRAAAEALLTAGKDGPGSHSAEEKAPEHGARPGEAPALAAGAGARTVSRETQPSAAAGAGPAALPGGRLRELIQLRRLSQLCDGMKRAEKVFAPLEELAEDPERARRLLAEGYPLGADLPRAVFGADDEIAAQLAQVKALGVRDALCGNLGTVRLARRAGLRVFGGFGLNAANRLALTELRGRGVSVCVLSFEPGLRRNADTAAGASESAALLAYGRLPLMLTRLCPLRDGAGLPCPFSPQKGRCAGGLLDRRNERFPVVCRRGRYSELLNTRPLWMCDRREQLARAGVSFALLSFTVESPDEAASVLAAFRSGAEPDAPFTRGLYARGVK